MLNQLRDAARSWVAGVFIALLVVSFAIWGVSDIFTSGGRDTVVSVGKQKVSAARLQQDFERELSRLSQQYGFDVTRDLARAQGVDQGVLSRLIYEAALRQKAEDLGLRVSDARLARELTTIPAFIDPISGRFDQATYFTLLSNNQLTPAQFEASLRDDLIQRQLAAAIGGGVRAPDVLARTRLRYARESRSVSYVAIPAEAAGAIAPPTDEELASFYAEREAAYTVPERRAFSFVTLTADDFLRDVPITGEALREAYEARADTLRTPETRDVVEMTAPDESTAQNVALRLRAGEEPDAIAEALGLAAPNRYDDAEAGALLTPASDEAAFATEVGAVSDPVDGGIAWIVVRVDAVTPSTQTTFEDAREDLRADLARDGAAELLFDAIDALEEARGRGARLEDAATDAKIPVFSYDVVARNGMDADGLRPAIFASHPELVRQAFDLAAVGVESELTEFGEDGYVVVRLDRIAPAEVPALSDVEDMVRATYLAFEREKRIADLAEVAKAALEAGETPSAAAAAVGAGAVGERAELPRGQAVGAIDRNLAFQLFAASVNEAVIGDAEGGGAVAARVDLVKPAPEPTQQELDDARALLSLEMAQDVGLLFQNGVRSAYRVSPVNQRLFDLATGAPGAQ